MCAVWICWFSKCMSGSMHCLVTVLHIFACFSGWTQVHKERSKRGGQKYKAWSKRVSIKFLLVIKLYSKCLKSFVFWGHSVSRFIWHAVFMFFYWWKINEYPYFLPFGRCRVCVIAGNISPIDVITHVPILCEEAEIPYVYVPSKEVS